MGHAVKRVIEVLAEGETSFIMIASRHVPHSSGTARELSFT
jgi:hypothetical protein